MNLFCKVCNYFTTLGLTLCIAGGRKAVQATEPSSALPVTPPTLLPQGQPLSIDEPPVPSPAAVPPHSWVLSVPPTPAPVGPEATAALFATKRELLRYFHLTVLLARAFNCTYCSFVPK